MSNSSNNKSLYEKIIEKTFQFIGEYDEFSPKTVSKLERLALQSKLTSKSAVLSVIQNDGEETNEAD